MDKIEIYIDELLEKSTPDRPIWNIEKILQGLKSTWNYIDGCMIKAILEMYAITKDEKYFRFADNFIDCKVREDGSIEGYSVEELNIDNVNAGKTLFELYDLTGKEKYRKAIGHCFSLLFLMFPLYQKTVVFPSKTTDLPGLESAENTVKNKSFMCIFFTLP